MLSDGLEPKFPWTVGWIEVADRYFFADSNDRGRYKVNYVSTGIRVI